jgi:uncharacterized protein (TIGR00730 family)
MTTPRPNGRTRPAPPHPSARRTPLPDTEPKPAEDDPDAPRRLRAILDGPAYRQADRDPDFLARDAMRGVRLQLDYEKPELLLEEAGIAHTIVVFGSTRLCEPAHAARRVADLEKAVAADPGAAELARRLAIARRVEAKSRYYDVARAFGRMVGASTRGIGGERVFIATGGGPGIMEAANRGAFDAGAKTAGLNIMLPREQYPNPYVTPELSFRFHYFALRKLHLVLRAVALVAFPGGYGTLDELFEVLTLIQTRTIPPIPVILVGRDYWQRAVDFDFLVEEGVIDPEDRELFWFAEEAEEIFDGILRWYEAAGRPFTLIDEDRA